MKRIKNVFKKGQATLESMLLIVVLLGFTLFVFDFMKQEELMMEIVDGPAQYIKGMAQSGVWDKAQQAKAKHPSTFYRHVMSEPQ